MDDQEVLEVLKDKEGKMKKGNDRFEALNALFKGDDGYSPKKGEDYFTQEEIDSFKEEIKKGATPEKFVDYFTDAEIEYLIDHIREGIIDEVTPIKGVHYDDGEDGKDADEVDVTALKSSIIKDIRILDEKQDAIDFAPEKLVEKINTLTAAIDPKAIKGWVRVEDVVKSIKEGKLLELRDIKGARLDSPSKASGGFNMNDQRWHGSGSGSAGSGTVTTVSVATANGFAGTVATATTTPVITVSTTVTGLLKGDGTAVSAAVANTDYQVPIILTTTGSSGAATFDGTTLNIPQYTGGSGGITRTIVSTASPLTAGSAAFTDYVYLVSGTTTITLPTAVGNTNRYTIKRVGTDPVTIATTSSQTIDGSLTALINVQYQSLDLVSDNANWNVI